MTPIVQSPNDLSLVVIAGELDLPVTVVQQTTYPLGDGQAIFRILSESHWLTLRCQGLVFHELLICSSQLRRLLAELPGHIHHFTQMQDYRYNDPQYDYELTIGFGSAGLWEPPIPSEQAMVANFAAVLGNVPQTEIAWRVQDGKLGWRTRHIYPMPNAIIHVVSESSITMPLAVH